MTSRFWLGLGVVGLALALAPGCDTGGNQVSAPLALCRSPAHQQTNVTFHGGAARLGWNSQEDALSPSAVGSSQFGHVWDSAAFDGTKLAGGELSGRAYASLLYADDMPIQGGPFNGAVVSALYAATTSGFVYAINAFEAPCTGGSLAAGSLLWRARLVTPDLVPALDGGVSLGTLSTPVLDLHASPPTLYVTAMDSAAGSFTWKAFALDARSGALLPGWPVVFDRASIEPLDSNGPAFFDFDARNMSQRGALALSPDGDRLYVTWGGYFDAAVGWIAAIDTQAPALVASFSSAPDTLIDNQGNLVRHPNGGMWGPSGPAVDAHGRVYMTTGNSESSWEATPATWGNSMLRWTKDLALEATYTPYDFCALDDGDVDVGGSGAALLPSLADLPTTTTNLVAFGGKQGVAYLLDTANVSGSLASRPACSSAWDDPSRDASLLPPTADGSYCNFAPHGLCVAPQPASPCVPGPLVTFGPLGDVANLNHAKMRTTAAYFRASDGTPYLYWSGSTKAALCMLDDIPPSVVRTRIAADGGGPAYLVRDGEDRELRFFNPGSPVVTSHGGADPVVWVVDANTIRTASLVGPDAAHPVLYAVDGMTMRLLYRSSDSDLAVGGKYVTPVIAHGTVFVATDRVQAFGMR